MDILYTATRKFDPSSPVTGDDLSFEKFKEWSRLTQLCELVSVDSWLCPSLCPSPLDDDWDDRGYDFLHIEGEMGTDFYTSLDFVKEQAAGKEPYNLLAVAIEPQRECRGEKIAHFVFLGYDLIDRCIEISPLCNCGGFDETFLPGELNQFGLVDDYERAREIQRDLVKNNPDEIHAAALVVAIWRSE